LVISSNKLINMRIGILGGTFNPIHIGHLILAEESMEKLGLDKVVFVPSYIPPHKRREGIASADDRYVMVVLAVRQNPKFEVSRAEIDRAGKSYSVDTLKEFKKRYGKNAGLFFITGSDSLPELDSWKAIDEILKLSQFVVATRPGYALEKLPQGARIVSITPVDISSSQIRKRVRGNRSIRYLVPEEVRKYIVDKRLYKGTSLRRT